MAAARCQDHASFGGVGAYRRCWASRVSTCRKGDAAQPPAGPSATRMCRRRCRRCGVDWQGRRRECSADGNGAPRMTPDRLRRNSVREVRQHASSSLAARLGSLGGSCRVMYAYRCKRGAGARGVRGIRGWWGGRHPARRPGGAFHSGRGGPRCRAVGRPFLAGPAGHGSARRAAGHDAGCHSRTSGAAGHRRKGIRPHAAAHRVRRGRVLRGTARLGAGTVCFGRIGRMGSVYLTPWRIQNGNSASGRNWTFDRRPGWTKQHRLPTCSPTSTCCSLASAPLGPPHVHSLEVLSWELEPESAPPGHPDALSSCCSGLVERGPQENGSSACGRADPLG